MCLMFFTNAMSEAEKSLDFAHRCIIVDKRRTKQYMTNNRCKSVTDFMISKLLLIIKLGPILIGPININAS